MTKAADVCGICGNASSRRILHFDECGRVGDKYSDVDVVQCRQCGIRRRFPGVIDVFDSDYHAGYVDEGVENIHPHIIQGFADLMTERLKLKPTASAMFLDIGCSIGRALRLAQALGFNVRGFEVSEWAAEYARHQGFHVDNAERLDGVYEDGSMDIVHCSHVIEHVSDPKALLAEIFRILKPGGQLILSCPNYASLPRLVKGRHWACWCLDSHLWFFTGGQVCRLVCQAGFRVARTRTLHGYVLDSPLKRRLLDVAALLGFGDAFGAIVIKPSDGQS